MRGIGGTISSDLSLIAPLAISNFALIITLLFILLLEVVLLFWPRFEIIILQRWLVYFRFECAFLQLSNFSLDFVEFLPLISVVSRQALYCLRTVNTSSHSWWWRWVRHHILIAMSLLWRVVYYWLIVWNVRYLLKIGCSFLLI